MADPNQGARRAHALDSHRATALAAVGLISPRDWELTPADPAGIAPWAAFGVDQGDWEERARQATCHWLMRNWLEDKGPLRAITASPTTPSRRPS